MNKVETLINQLSQSVEGTLFLLVIAGLIVWLFLKIPWGNIFKFIIALLILTLVIFWLSNNKVIDMGKIGEHAKGLQEKVKEWQPAMPKTSIPTTPAAKPQTLIPPKPAPVPPEVAAETTAPMPNVFQKYAHQQAWTNPAPVKPVAPQVEAQKVEPMPNVFQKYAKQKTWTPSPWGQSEQAPIMPQTLNVIQQGDTKHGYFSSTNCQTAQPIPTENITVSVNLTCVGNCEHKVETGQIWTTPTGKLCQTTRIKSQ